MKRTSVAEARKELPHGLPKLKKLNHGGIECCVGNQTPGFPHEFNRQLQELDPDLWVTWHHPPTWPASKLGRWKIEMCTEHLSGLRFTSGKPQHTHQCRRIYVWMVQTEDEARDFMPLGEHVLNKLREMRANSEKFGGQTPRGLENYIRHSNNLDQALQAKREQATEDIKRHNSRFNRRQLSKAFDLMSRHDTARPNK